MVVVERNHDLARREERLIVHVGGAGEQAARLVDVLKVDPNVDAVEAGFNARYGDALKVWETRIIDYVGHRDEHTIELAKQLDQLQRKGIDSEQVLDLAAARKPLPTDHATAALAYRVRELVAPKRTRRTVQSAESFERSQQPGGPSLGM